MFKDLTAIIVTFKSHKIINKTIDCLPKSLKILIIENSKDKKFKKNIEKKYPNVKCTLTGKNIGWGRATNIGIEKAKTNYILCLNPDLFIKHKALIKTFETIKKDNEIGVIAPSTIDIKKRIYIRHKEIKSNFIKEKKKLIEVSKLSGHIFIIRRKILSNVGKLDKKIFLNFEETDLFKRIIEKGYRLFVLKNVFAQHLEGKSADPLIQMEMDLSSAWHYSWGIIYFNRKHYGILFSLLIFIKLFVLKTITLFYFILMNDKKKQKYTILSLSGLISSLLKKPSYYRPKI